MSLLQVKSLPFFSEVDTKVLDVWLRTFSPRTRHYKKGSIIHFQGQPYTELQFIISGEVAAEIGDYDGKVLKVETLRAPEPIAAAVLFAEDNSLPVTTAAKTDVSLLIIPKAEILRLCGISEDFLRKLLSDMGNKLTLLAQKIRFLQFGTIRQKIAGYLLDEMRKQRSSTLKIPHTKETLSEIFGVTRPSFSRVFSELCRENVIRQEGKTVTILLAAKLKEMMAEND
jgi:CRP-like cAMP-binding protein